MEWIQGQRLLDFYMKSPASSQILRCSPALSPENPVGCWCPPRCERLRWGFWRLSLGAACCVQGRARSCALPPWRAVSHWSNSVPLPGCCQRQHSSDSGCTCYTVSHTRIDQLMCGYSIYKIFFLDSASSWEIQVTETETDSDIIFYKCLENKHW